MYKVGHGTDPETMKVIGTVDNIEDAYLIINKTIDERGIKSYYIRSWGDPEEFITQDYGSWTNFFFIKKVAASGG